MYYTKTVPKATCLNIYNQYIQMLTFVLKQQKVVLGYDTVVI